MTILKILILNPIQWVITIGAIVFVFGALTISLVLVSIGYREREVKQIAAAIKPGMTMDQAAAVFPAGFWYANIGVPLRTSICKDAEGHIVPADEHLVWPFPDMAQDDSVGERLSGDASQLTFRLERLELLDRHLLRSRKRLGDPCQRLDGVHPR